MSRKGDSWLWVALGAAVLLFIFRNKAISAVTPLFDPTRRQIEREEGRKNYAYQDSAGIWTFGVGHKIRPGEESLRTWTPQNPAPDEVVDRYYEMDIAWAKGEVRQLGIALTENQQAALVSFVFNLGVPNFRGSTVYSRLKAGDYPGAAQAMLLWKKAGNNPDALLARREREKELFETA